VKAPSSRRIVRDHPPMLVDYVSTTTGKVCSTACECCNAIVADGRAATRAEQDAHALSCSGITCRSRHEAEQKAGAK
jgi:hypothetical protein